jgi:predicted HicB family RNase H-like nuclease
MMEYKGYIGRVEFDDEAGALHGEVVGIRDVVTFEGTSVAEIEQAFQDSVDDYLDFCRERGEPPEKPCSGKFLVRIGSDLHRRISLAAEISGQSLNALVTECLDREAASRLAGLGERPGGGSKPPKKGRPSRPQRTRP